MRWFTQVNANSVAANVIKHILKYLASKGMREYIMGKSPISAHFVKGNLHALVVWSHMKELTLMKNHISASNVTGHFHRPLPKTNMRKHVFSLLLVLKLRIVPKLHLQIFLLVKYSELFCIVYSYDIPRTYTKYDFVSIYIFCVGFSCHFAENLKRNE